MKLQSATATTAITTIIPTVNNCKMNILNKSESENKPKEWRRETNGNTAIILNMNEVKPIGQHVNDFIPIKLNSVCTHIPNLTHSLQNQSCTFFQQILFTFCQRRDCDFCVVCPCLLLGTKYVVM